MNCCVILFRLFISFSLLCSITHAYAKTVLVTAATGNLGRAVSFHFAKKGYNVFISGRNEKKLFTLKEEILSQYSNSKVNTLVIDFSKVDNMRSVIKAQKINLDGVVLIGPRPLLNKEKLPSVEQWMDAFYQTFISPLELLKVLEDKIVENGSIVIMSGSTSKDYLKKYPNMNVIRLAWSGAIKNVMHFFSNKKIRVNAVSPGVVFTKYHKDIIAKEALNNNTTFNKQLENNTNSIPLGKYCDLEDVANLVYFLISSDSKYINGTNILLDGGASNTY